MLDADALTLYDGKAERPIVCTPHLGEFRALAGDQLADAAANDRWAATAKAAQKLRGCVLLKGVPTVIADVRGPTLVVASGNPGLATGGSGDVLAGFIGAFLARGLPAPEAAALGRPRAGPRRGARARAPGPPAASARPTCWPRSPTCGARGPPCIPLGPPVMAVLEPPEAV